MKNASSAAAAAAAAAGSNKSGMEDVSDITSACACVRGVNTKSFHI